MSESDSLHEFNKKTFAKQPQFEDAEIVCIDCGGIFVWSGGEQLFYNDKGLQNPPKRCKSCKQAKNERLAAIANAQAAGVKQRVEVAVHCAKCDNYTTVPFYPSQGRPVYCRSCFLAMNPNLIDNK
ncbi:MAG: zinc-ribbon domain containing protein [Pyrinomonadaceae bacterium]